MSTFDTLVTDLTRDVQRVQPKDVLHSVQTEQRTRTRDALAHRPSLAANLPPDHYIDTPIAPQPTRSNPSPFTDPFEPRRISLQASGSQGTFGALNVSGNGLFSSDGMPDPTTTTTFPPPSFRFDSEPTPVDPYSVLDHITPSQSPAPGDYLHPPGFNLMERRASVSAEPISVDSENHQPLPVYPKTEDQLRRIKASTKNNFLFRDLDEEQETGVLNAMRETHVTAGQVVIRQGDVGDYFYVVESGLLHCYIRTPQPPSGRRSWGPDKASPDADVDVQFGKLVQKCTPGTSFGDLALMYGHPRAASVVAVEPSTLWCLDRITFRTIILNAAHRRRTMYEQFLSTVTLLSSLSPTERSKIADALVSQAYDDGEPVVRQGDMGDTFFFVEEGEAEVTKTHQGDDGETREIVVGHLARGDYFGELSLLRLAPRAATVSAIRRPPDSNFPGLKVAGLDAQAFTRLLGPLREIMERNAGTYGSYGHGFVVGH
ncbi:camp-dependent protein kinase regulatory subunit [Multifurca ochricompacta]|uniref:cAMP-dependent protein kinase regulatory subunit n=1 Tax=Multifurca ochricompacta TaxID=376703 RepID=A0AAD4MAU9_9AGAM|nr:camp-dependent protein kinase regulatory subunit [Multifurca ochricompacta]